MVRWRQRTIFTSCTHRKSNHLSSLCLSFSNSTLSESRTPIHYWPHRAVPYRTSPSSDIRTSGWSLHNQMTLAFRGAFIVPELPYDSKMIRCHLTFPFRNRWPWHAAWSVGLPCILLFVSVTELFFFRLLHVCLFRAKSPLTFSVAKLVQAVFCKYQCLIPWIFSKTFCRLTYSGKNFSWPRVKKSGNFLHVILPLPTLIAT